MINAPVNRIIQFSNVDGPGNRLALFLQKCPLKCLYCHNPETINECIHCGVCVGKCQVSALSFVDGKVKWDKNICVNCDSCIKVCPHLSTPKTTLMSVDEVVAEIMKVKMFIRGITVSGGECMSHPKFLTELFKKVNKLGLDCLIDSSGFYDFQLYPELLENCAGVMLDVKAFDNEFHKVLTSQENGTILENLKYLLEINKLYEVRTVLMNGQEEQNTNTVINVAKIIQDKCRYKLIKYRPFGVRDSLLPILGKNILSDDELNKYESLAIENGARNTVVV